MCDLECLPSHPRLTPHFVILWSLLSLRVRVCRFLPFFFSSWPLQEMRQGSPDARIWKKRRPTFKSNHIPDFPICYLFSREIASQHGTRALQKKLANELGKHIERTAPHVKKQLQSKKEELIKRLLEYGVDENGVLHSERANNKKIMWQYVLSCHPCLSLTIQFLRCNAVLYYGHEDIQSLETLYILDSWC